MSFLTRHKIPLLISLGTIALFHAAVALLGPDYYYSKGIWDEGYYRLIITDGYVMGSDYTVDSPLAFAPGYPFLWKAFAWITCMDPEHLQPARSVVSAILFVIGSLGVSVLFDSFSVNRTRRNVAVLFFAVWPGSIYFLTAYAEALYLPLAVWCLVCLTQRRYFLASILVALALFTRSPAIVLVPTIFITMLVHALRDESSRGWQTRPIWVALRLVPWMFLFGLICSLGTLGYVLTVYLYIGDPLAFVRAYVAWVGIRDIGWEKWFVMPWHAWLTYGHVSIRLGVAFFVAIPPLLLLWKHRLPVPALAFAGVAWLFFLTGSGQSRPFVDLLRWTALLVPVHYSVVLSLEWLGKQLGHRKPLLLPSLIVVAMSVPVYVFFVERFTKFLWVS